MDMLSLAQWTRVILYALIGVLAYLNSLAYRGVMRVYRQTISLLAFALAAAVMCNAMQPDWSPLFNAAILTPLVAFFFVLELIVLINHHRNHRPHRRMDD